jgi:hypothetical protein
MMTRTRMTIRIRATSLTWPWYCRPNPIADGAPGPDPEVLVERHRIDPFHGAIVPA